MGPPDGGGVGNDRASSVRWYWRFMAGGHGALQEPN